MTAADIASCATYRRLLRQEVKCSHSVELAKSNYAASKAAYEVRLEALDTREMELRARHQRTAQVVLSIALPLMFVGSGVPLVVHGREISSLSFTALGLGLVAMAVFPAAGRFVMLFRPSKEQEARKAELQSAQWVMLQDKKKYESCLAEQEALGEIRAFLESRGLGGGLIELAPCADDSRRGERRSR